MIPEGLLDLIRRFEGLRLRAYYCPAGVLTCGYGTTGPDITPTTVWTKEQAEARMRADAARFVTTAMLLCPGQTEQTIAALADFAYNLGATRLASSTLRRKINQRQIAAAKVELRKWVRSGHRILPGLVRRREAEAALLR
jgi:lysozyme